MKTSLLAIAVVFLTGYSCSSDNSETKTVTEKSKVSMQNAPENDSKEADEVVAPKSVQLKGKFLKDFEYGSKLYTVLLLVDGKTTAIDTVMACETIPSSNFDQYDIPKTAKSACGGWWAGAGDYFYATIEKNKVVVYQGWQDEQQEDEGYHWKVMQLK